MNDIWFTSDQHYGHRNLATKHRDFSCLEEMEDTITENYLSLVKPEDTVYMLGDFSFYNVTKTHAIFADLPGIKHMVWGNHDVRVTRKKLSGMFESEQDIKELKVGEQRLVLCHFPLLSWNQVAKGSWHLHGHCHANLPENPEMAMMDVGVDTFTHSHAKYTPWHIDEIAERLQDRHGRPNDHHNRYD